MIDFLYTVLGYLLSLFKVLAVIVLLIAALLYFFQNKILYIPQIQNQIARSPKDNPRGFRNPSQQQLNYKEVSIDTSDGQTLRGWLVLTDTPKESRTIIFFHQNAGNIGARLVFVRENLRRTNSNILLVAYRGYSDSTGQPSQTGLKKDGLAILNFALQCTDINPNLIYLHGRSLGGAVAAYVASTDSYSKSIKGVILQNTFTSISDMVDIVFRPVRHLKIFVLRNYWETYKIVPNIKVPILFIKSAKDELVPLAQMQKLAGIAKEHDLVRREVLIRHATHNVTYEHNPQLYFGEMLGFFRQECRQQ